MNAGSIGEIPPSTRATDACSARIACQAVFSIRVKIDQSGSSSKSQCKRSLGSFHTITASTMRLALPVPEVRLYAIEPHHVSDIQTAPRLR